MPQQGYVSIEDDIRAEAAKQGVPLDLALSVAEQESGFNPTSVNPASGAIGTFQFLPATAKRRGIDATDQRVNVVEGVKYLRELLDKHQGDPEAVLKEYGGVKNDTTYVPSVMQRMAKYADQTAPPLSGHDTSQQFVGAPPLSPQETKTRARQDMTDRIKKFVGDNYVEPVAGAVRGAVSTVQTLASPIRKAFGMAPAIPPPEETTTGGRVGRGAEKIGEFMVPAGVITKGAAALKGASTVANAAVTGGEMLAQGGAAYGVSKHQGASDKGATVNAALAAVSPLVSKAMELQIPRLLASAQKKLAAVYSQALENKGPMVDYALKTGEAGTKAVEHSLNIVRQAAADTLDLPIQASWGKWMTTLAKNAQGKGQTLGEALSGPMGDVEIPKAPIVKALDDLIDAGTRHFAEMPEGDFRQITYAAPLQKELGVLKEQLSQYGEHLTARNLTDIKRTWDSYVYTLSTAGKVGMTPETLISSAMKEAMNTGANAIRGALETHAPDLARLNEAATHAYRLQDLVEKLYKVSPGMNRNGQLIAHGIGLFGGGSAGQALGGHWIIGSTLGSTAAKSLVQAMASPLWQTADPAVKNAVAKAIASGEGNAVLSLVRPFLLRTNVAAAATP